MKNKQEFNIVTQNYEYEYGGAKKAGQKIRTYEFSNEHLICTIIEYNADLKPYDWSKQTIIKKIDIYDLHMDINTVSIKYYNDWKGRYADNKGTLYINCPADKSPEFDNMRKWLKVNFNDWIKGELNDK